MDETAVFEQAGTIEKWDRDYYHPIAERYYDRAIPAMLYLMGVPAAAAHPARLATHPQNVS
jgi:hypothetical protein